MSDKTVWLRCPSCDHDASVPLDKLPLPAANTTCPKCKTIMPMYYFISSLQPSKSCNPITSKAISCIKAETEEHINTLNKMKPKYTWGCPVCNIGLSASFGPESITEVDLQTRFRKRVIRITQQECPFCKTTMAIFLDNSGEFEAIDIEYDEKDHAYRTEMQQFNTDIGLARCNFDAAESEKECLTAEKKLDALERKLETLEQRYDDFKDKYEDKRSRWQDKVYEKYGDSGPYKP